MRDVLGQNTVLGYCTNVHAGVDLPRTKANLEQHACRVKELVSPDAPMGVGLWLPSPAARQLLEGDNLPSFRDWLGERGLMVYTLNGFPYGDFHQEVVKHKVYRPDWREDGRLQYTLNLIEVLDGLLPEGAEGSISTLPLGWTGVLEKDGGAAAVVSNFTKLVHHLGRLRQERGRLIHVDLEPEPGCALQRGEDVVRFFQEHLHQAGDPDQVRRFVRVCHDICHSAVMFDSQAEVLDAYEGTGIKVGKVQISSAVQVDFDGLSGSARGEAREQLAAFEEKRYLHQTVIRSGGGDRFYEDLPLALAENPVPEGEWRVHFHVPVFLDRFGRLTATQADIREGMGILLERGEVRHFEVETYAWGVLPEGLQRDSLAEGIAEELRWVAGAMSERSPA